MRLRQQPLERAEEEQPEGQVEGCCDDVMGEWFVFVCAYGLVLLRSEWMQQNLRGEMMVGVAGPYT